MQYRNLGKTGLKVSRIALGCMSYADPSKGSHNWVLNEDQSAPFFRRAIEAGINFFDTANAYSEGASEEVLGRAIRKYTTRESAVIATKVFNPMRSDPNGRGLSRKAIFHEIDASLRRLGTDYIDLYQIHRWDYATPIEETLEALHDVVPAGKARYIGASSMFAWQFMKALSLQRMYGWAQFVSMQDHLNLLYREEEREMLPLCREEGIGVIPWSPLARGRLTRPWQSDTPTAREKGDEIGRGFYDRSEAADRRVVERLCALAQTREQPPGRVALAWLLHKPGITAPIVGATKLGQLEDAIQATELDLSAAEIAALEEPYGPHAISGHD
ncbi:aldo/keto reductase [Terrarubrum flagellatum]|uniref:aldo/keto reductase n=1 Tax=Terrirubrum flagellatum TaxID=2895980 RepID=UPI003145311B